MTSKNVVVRVMTFLFFLALLNASLPRIEAQTENKTPLTVYSNTSPITINSAPTTTAPTIASLYPSTINVSGMTGTTTRVAVSLRGLTHGRTRDMDFLLVSPTGGKFVFLADATGNDQFNNNDTVVSFSDDAPTTHFFGNPLLPGSYKPINFDGNTDTFPAPAPAAPYNFPTAATFASVFNGADPNGAWSLYAVDDQIGVSGSVNSGWELTITTSGAPQTFSNSTYVGLDDVVTRATPYASTINVSGASGVVSNLKVTLSGLTHTLPENIDILLVNPNGRAIILMSDAGSIPASGVNLTFDDAAANNVPSQTITSGTYKPTNFNSSGIVEDGFPAPAPFRPYFEFNNDLSNFNNFSPNGDWSLYVVDDRANDAGTIAGGWSLDITTSPVQPPAVGCAFPNLVPTNSLVSGGPTNLAVGDFNNDTKQDLAVTNQVSGNVSILLGNGSGGFASQSLVTVGTSPYAVAVGRFNADSNDDLVVVNSGGNNVSILLGNGNGTFSAPTNFNVGSNPISVSVGDVNNDGRQDLVVANFGGFFTGAVSILLGDLTGGFGFPTTLRTRTQPAFVKLANLNGDGNLDLVVANFGSDSVSTYFGNGNGTFTVSQNLNTTSSSGPVSVDIGNIDGNSLPDLVVANYNGDDVRIFNGTGNGIFNSVGLSSGSIGANPISVVAADLLGDGSDKVAVALSGSATIGVSTTSFLGNFQQFLTGSNPNAIVKGDFNNDSKVDLATANFGSNDVTVLINSCIAANGNIFDFNGDRRTDFSVFRPPLSQWWVFPTTVPTVFGRETDKIVPADYNGDRLTELAIFRPENGLWHVVNNSSSTGAAYFLQFGLANDIPSPADFDGDRKADLAVFRPSDGNWYIRRSSDNALQIGQFGMNGDKPVAADYDGDGKADLAVFRPSTSVWYIWRSSDGQFAIQQFGISTDQLVPNDYDGDNKADIAVFRDGVWYISKSSDQNVIVQSWGLSGDIPLAGDFEGDGRFDFAVFRPADRTWYILRSSDGGTQGFQYGLTTDIPLPSAFVR